MNVLFYQDTCGVSGGEIWIADTARRLRERGHAISLAAPTESWMAAQARHHGFQLVDFFSKDGFDAHRRWVLAEHIAEAQIDIVVCSIPGSRMEVPLLDQAVRDAGRGRILIRLGVAPGEGAFPPERVGYGYDTVGGIIAVSRDIKHHLVQNFPMLDKDRIHVVYNGVDLEQFSPNTHSDVARAALRRDLDIPADHRVIAAVGRLDPIKNLPCLVDAAETVLERHPATTFVIAGDGAERVTLEHAVDSKGLRHAFRFPGFVKDVPGLLSIVDIVVHPALSEGVPNTLLEAMASQKAIVASNVGGISEVVDTSEKGALIPPADPDILAEELSSLVGDEGRRTQLGAAARTHVLKHFDRAANVTQIEHLFEQLRGSTKPLAPVTEQPLYDPPYGLTARDHLLRA